MKNIKKNLFNFVEAVIINLIIITLFVLFFEPKTFHDVRLIIEENFILLGFILFLTSLYESNLTNDPMSVMKDEK